IFASNRIAETRDWQPSRQREFEKVELCIVQHPIWRKRGTVHCCRIPSILSVMSHQDAESLHPSSQGDRAVHAALDAAALLMALRSDVRPDARVFDADALRREGDARAHASILKSLSADFPGDVILSEEGRDPSERLGADRVWIVDPLDGTREFGEHQAAHGWREDFAIHIARWERPFGLVFGAVVLPARGETYRSDRPVALPTPAPGPIRVAVSRTRPPRRLEQLESDGGIQLVQMGSAGYKTIAVLRGEAHAYVHDGGQYQWDSAAPVAVAAAAGCVTTRLDGTALTYNATELSIPDLFIAHPQVAVRLRRLLDAESDERAHGAAE
ncbi:MAG: 3'(2'),5'-bisphosphate nucleotidase CysQ, partial [Actinomycetales bacterium]